MPLFPYTINIPDGPNNPSQDQPKMKINTNSIDGIIDIDHYSFGEANGGLHRQVQMPNLLVIPPGLSASTGNLYSKLGQSTGVLTESNIYFSPSNSGNEYQLTRPVTASIATFGTYTVDTITPNVLANYGWTFLPGGLLFQYGTCDFVTSGTQTISFPVSFTTGGGNGVYSLNATIRATNTALRVTTDNITITDFDAVVTGAAAGGTIYWQAIGK